MKRKVTIFTIVSALLYGLVIILTTLTPLAEIGESANQFNTAGMWLAVSIVLACYFVPLLFFLLGLTWIKYVMAALCGIGLLSFLPMFLGILLFMAKDGVSLSLFAVLVTCGAGILINLMWYFAAFRTNRLIS
ncbi:hypothetical protein ERJ70_00535 [Sediminibacillus dalangtanensis]|uniref:Uncharacterized protein n=1 Tax=Sediminibacillus dalangtanensis TaxID=2729421 RepID=A0ABX7VMA8_9BACI|nr:DUF5391 family protein [Sediminibacillus dalangtanensis]QTM97942.1 hypothetical protein ERJ70_00535 [Sediminibacillus dalangtanensis]